MIGKIVKIITPYYDMKTATMKTKSRPGLVIAGYGVNDNDYIVLPISSISDRRRRNRNYDIEIDPIMYPKTNLNKLSYIRTHKQVTINRKEIGGIISDFRNAYEDKYLEVVEKISEFDVEKIKIATAV